MSIDTTKRNDSPEAAGDNPPTLKPYNPPEIKSAKIFERLCLKCLKRPGVCADSVAASN